VAQPSSLLRCYDRMDGSVLHDSREQAPIQVQASSEANVMLPEIGHKH
jgi:hypothetical protein